MRGVPEGGLCRMSQKDVAQLEQTDLQREAFRRGRQRMCEVQEEVASGGVAQNRAQELRNHIWTKLRYCSEIWKTNVKNRPFVLSRCRLDLEGQSKEQAIRLVKMQARIASKIQQALAGGGKSQSPKSLASGSRKVEESNAQACLIQQHSVLPLRRIFVL